MRQRSAWEILGLGCIAAALGSASGRAQAPPGQPAPPPALVVNCNQVSPPEFVDLVVTVSRPTGGPVTAALDYKLAEVCAGVKGPRKVRWTVVDTDLSTTLVVAWRWTATNPVNYFQLAGNNSRQVRVATVVGAPAAAKAWDYELVVLLGDGNAIAVDPQIIWR